MSDLRRRVLYDHDGDALTSHVRQDVEPYLENNARQRSQEQHSDFWRHTASIPLVVIEQWLNEEWARGNTSITLGSREFDELIQRKLKDHDWLFLHTDKPPPAYRR